MGPSIPDEPTASPQTAPSERNALAVPPVEGAKQRPAALRFDIFRDQQLADEMKFLVTPSSEGVINIKIGSAHTFHAPKHTSAHHPLVQMVLLARNDLCVDTFVCPKSFVPKGIVATVVPKGTSPNDMYQAGCIIPPKCQSATSSGGISDSEATVPMEGNGGSDEASLLAITSCTAIVASAVRAKTSQEDDTTEYYYDAVDDDTVTGDGHVCMVKSVADGSSPACQQGTVATSINVEKNVAATAAGSDCKALSLHQQNTPLALNGSADSSTSDDTESGHNRDNGKCSFFRLVDEKMKIHLDGEGTPLTANRPKQWFIVDSGASVHAMGNKDLISGLTIARTGCAIRVASGHFLPICGHGSVEFEGFTLHDVKYVPGLKANVISISKLGDIGYNVQFTRNVCSIKKAGVTEDVLVAEAKLIDRLFKLCL